MEKEMERVHQPNPYYYDENSGIQHNFFDENSNSKLAEFGIKNHLSCGGVWILGKNFAFCIEYAADSYNHMAKVREFGKSITRKWYKLHEHLCSFEHTLHTLKSRDEIANNLGLK